MDERRSEPRYELPEPLPAKVKASVPARVLDLSSRGVLLEIAQSLRPNVTCELRVQLDGSDLGVRALVRRCKAVGFGVDEQNRRVLLYRAGLEFQEMASDVQARLVAALERVALSQTAPDMPVPESQSAGDGDHALAVEAAPEAPPRRVPRQGGPIKIKISSEHVRKIINSGS